jgi:hypothetical protein
MLGCDVSVLVVCPDRGVAAHYAQPIDSGLTGYRLHARVLGPDGIPPITDPHEAAAHLELSAMSVMVHGRDHKVIEAFTAAVADTLDKHVLKYYEYPYGMSAPEICRADRAGRPRFRHPRRHPRPDHRLHRSHPTPLLAHPRRPTQTLESLFNEPNY